MGMGEDAYQDSLCEEAGYEGLKQHYLDSNIWVTKAGEQIQIADLTSKHLYNCIKILKDSKADLADEWLRKLMREYDRRQLLIQLESADSLEELKYILEEVIQEVFKP